MFKIELYITFVFVILFHSVSFSQNSRERKSSFEHKIQDSLVKYLNLHQDDIILKFTIIIDPISYEFITCKACNNNELKYLDLDLIRKDFFEILDKKSCEKIKEKQLYEIRINSVTGEYRCVKK